MKKRFFYTICILFSLLLISSCKTLNTNLSISERKIPASFQSSADTVTIANINWRKYFADTVLASLIDTAIKSNTDLKMALQRIEIARAGIKFTNGVLLPSVNAAGVIGVDKYAKYTPDYAGNSTTEYEPGKIVPSPLENYYLGLQTAWEIDIWGKLRNQRKSALANYLASIQGTNFVISNLVSDVTISYYELLALDNKLDIIQQTIKKQQEALEVVQLQKETGRANKSAVHQFKAQLLNSKALEKETLQQIAETENRINFLLGRYPQTIERKKEDLFREISQQIVVGIPSQLLQNRPDIREAALQVQVSKFDLKSSKAAFLPNLNITAAFGFQSFLPQFLFINPASLGYSALGGLTAPLINRSALKAQFNTAKANQLTAMYNYQKTILNGFVEVRNELSNIQNLQDINALKKEQNEELLKSVETSTELFRTGKSGYLEVLLAQQNSLQTQLELVNTSKRQRIATVNIYKALGGGWR